MQKKYLMIFIAIFLLGAGLRVGYFFLNAYNMDRYDDEAWSKINVTNEWIRHPSHSIGTTFAPLHTYIISSFWFISPKHYIILSRFLSLIFGILFILLYFYLLRELFDIKSAYFGAFLLAIFPMHIHLSSVSLPDMPGCFLLFSSLYLLCRFIKNNKIYYLALSAVSLNLSCMLRYESWIFVFLFTLILFLRYKFSWYVFMFFALSCIFPILWLIYTYKVTGDPLNFIKVSALVNQGTMQDISLSNRAAGFILVLFRTLSPPIFICCVVGFCLSLTKGKSIRNNFFLILFPLLLFVYTLKSIQGTYDFTINRYSFALGLLFLPFGGLTVGLYSLKLKKILLSCLILLCLFYSLKTMQRFYIEGKVSESLISLVSWVKSNIKNNEKVLLECGNYHPFIMINSNLLCSKNIVEYNHKKFVLTGNEYLEKYIYDADYIIVYKIRGLFKEAVSNVKFPNKLKVIFENEEWCIFKIVQ